MMLMHNARSPHNSHAQGFTLVEVLVALVVLSIGLLGLAALQLTSLSLNTASYFRTQATVAAYDLIDRMRSNRTGFTANGYHAPSQSAADAKVSSYDSCKTGTCDCEANACDTTSLALYDLGKWYMLTESILPQSNGANRATVSRDSATNQVTITIKWVEKDLAQTASWTVQL